MQNRKHSSVYRIKIQGHLDSSWSEWFEGFTIRPQAEDETLLTGSVADQIALHGLLSTIRDLGLTLLSVERIEAASLADEQTPEGE